MSTSGWNCAATSSTAEPTPSRCRNRSHSPVPATSSASIARAVVRTRAARLDHQLRAELPRRDRLLRRGLPLALHPRRGRHRARAAASVDRARRAEGRRVRRGRHLERPAAVHHRQRSRDGVPPPGRAVGLGTRARQPQPRRQPAEVVSTTCRRDRPAAARGAERERRPRLLAAHVPAEAGTEHRVPRVRRAGVRDRPACRAEDHDRQTSRGDPIGVGSDRPATDGSPATSAGTSAPARTATSRRSCACSFRSQSTRASADATWTSSTLAPNVRGVDNPDLGGILRLGGALQAPRIDPPDRSSIAGMCPTPGRCRPISPR